MTNTPSPSRLSTLPKWAQEYIAWLRERVSSLELEYRHASEEATKLMRKVETVTTPSPKGDGFSGQHSVVLTPTSAPSGPMPPRRLASSVWVPKEPA